MNRFLYHKDWKWINKSFSVFVVRDGDYELRLGVKSECYNHRRIETTNAYECIFDCVMLFILTWLVASIFSHYPHEYKKQKHLHQLSFITTNNIMNS